MARWRTPGVASGPCQRQASFTSPPSETHSASASAGTRACGIPGATLAAVAGSRWASWSATKRDGGRVGIRVEGPAPAGLRRAGSTKAASHPAAVGSNVDDVLARTSTESASPRASALARATATVVGSWSTPRTASPARARASRSPPTPQHRSATRCARRPGEAGGPMVGHGGAGRLLEPRRRPEQDVGVGPEPGRRALPEAYLGDDDGHEPGRDALGAQPGHRREVVARRRARRAAASSARPSGEVSRSTSSGVTRPEPATPARPRRAAGTRVDGVLTRWLTCELALSLGKCQRSDGS